VAEHPQNIMLIPNTTQKRETTATSINSNEQDTNIKVKTKYHNNCKRNNGGRKNIIQNKL
jgi:hypothetical protein